MTPLFLALSLAAHPVTVQVMERLRPSHLTLSGPRTVDLQVREGGLRVDGSLAPDLALPEGTWRVAGPGIRPRSYQGAILARVRGGAIELRVRMELEAYVAAVVASETAPGTPGAALRAQAIVSRSYALASHRHPDADLCDRAHCQILSGRGPADHLRAAELAARATEGQVLARRGGAVAAAVFHASCAGSTADPAMVFGGRDRTGASSVADPGCGPGWEAVVPASTFSRVAGELLGEGPCPPEQLVLERSAGGYVTRIRDSRTGRWVRGDALARGLDRALERSSVRSTHFWLDDKDGKVRLQGRGIGHGVGLCQAGAARMAAAGADEKAILLHYFPRSTLSRLQPAHPAAAPGRGGPHPGGVASLAGR